MPVYFGDFHPALIELFHAAQRRGWLSYEELNSTLPDEMIDPYRIDEVLYAADQLGIELLDEVNFEARMLEQAKDRGEAYTPRRGTQFLPAAFRPAPPSRRPRMAGRRWCVLRRPSPLPSA